ncbi:MAG: hypothetical protein ACP5RD_06295 [bacterium]|jgi:hypothetical protein
MKIKDELIKKLKKELVSIRIQAIIFLIISSVFILSIVHKLSSKFLLFLIIILFYVLFSFFIFIYYEYKWSINCKKIIIQDLNKITESNLGVKIKYNPSLNSNEKSSIDFLLHFINNFLLVNKNDNLHKVIFAIKTKYKHNYNFKMKDKIIIETKNTSLKIIEIKLQDRYIEFTDEYSTPIDIINFQGICIITSFLNSTLFNNPLIILNPA